MIAQTEGTTGTGAGGGWVTAGTLTATAVGLFVLMLLVAAPGTVMGGIAFSRLQNGFWTPWIETPMLNVTQKANISDATIVQLYATNIHAQLVWANTGIFNVANITDATFGDLYATNIHTQTFWAAQAVITQLQVQTFTAVVANISDATITTLYSTTMHTQTFWAAVANITDATFTNVYSSSVHTQVLWSATGVIDALTSSVANITDASFATLYSSFAAITSLEATCLKGVSLMHTANGPLATTHNIQRLGGAGARAMTLSATELALMVDKEFTIHSTTAQLHTITLSGGATWPDGLTVLTFPAVVGETVTFRVLSSTSVEIPSPDLTRRSQLPYSNAASPHVSYRVAIGGFGGVPENTWRTGIFPFFLPIYLPGIAPGDGGQGNIFGVSWRVPVEGFYTVAAHCSLIVSGIDTDTHQSIEAAITLGASSDDPFAGGFIPEGGLASLDINTGSLAGSGPTIFFGRRLSMTASFHACGSGCPVAVNDRLALHLRQDHSSTGASSPVTFNAFCRMQVAHTH